MMTNRMSSAEGMSRRFSLGLPIFLFFFIAEEGVEDGGDG